MRVEVDALPESETRIQIREDNRCADKAFDQRSFDRAQLIGAAEVRFDVADEPVEQLCRIGALIERSTR